MKKTLSIVLPCVAACLLVSPFSLIAPLHYRIASDPTLKGKGNDGRCLDYALALSSTLARNGIHGQLIFYRWQIRNTEIKGDHVFVMYHLPDNSEWIVDNETAHPREVPVNASPMQLVFLLANAESAPVDVELQDGLNHLGYF